MITGSMKKSMKKLMKVLMKGAMKVSMTGQIMIQVPNMDQENVAPFEQLNHQLDVHTDQILSDQKAVSYTHLTLPTICSV